MKWLKSVYRLIFGWNPFDLKTSKLCSRIRTKKFVFKKEVLQEYLDQFDFKSESDVKLFLDKRFLDWMQLQVKSKSYGFFKNSIFSIAKPNLVGKLDKFGGKYAEYLSSNSVNTLNSFLEGDFECLKNATSGDLGEGISASKVEFDFGIELFNNFCTKMLRQLTNNDLDILADFTSYQVKRPDLTGLEKEYFNHIAGIMADVNEIKKQIGDIKNTYFAYTSRKVYTKIVPKIKNLIIGQIYASDLNQRLPFMNSLGVVDDYVLMNMMFVRGELEVSPECSHQVLLGDFEDSKEIFLKMI